MFKQGFQIFAALLVLSLMVVYCEGQVTFSRGWTPGKRGPEGAGGFTEQHVVMKTATQLYRLLINQIQQLAECTAHHVEDNENTAVPIFT